MPHTHLSNGNTLLTFYLSDFEALRSGSLILFLCLNSTHTFANLIDSSDTRFVCVSTPIASPDVIQIEVLCHQTSTRTLDCLASLICRSPCSDPRSRQCVQRCLDLVLTLVDHMLALDLVLDEYMVLANRFKQGTGDIMFKCLDRLIKTTKVDCVLELPTSRTDDDHGILLRGIAPWCTGFSISINVELSRDISLTVSHIDAAPNDLQSCGSFGSSFRLSFFNGHWNRDEWSDIQDTTHQLTPLAFESRYIFFHLTIPTTCDRNSDPTRSRVDYIDSLACARMQHGVRPLLNSSAASSSSTPLMDIVYFPLSRFAHSHQTPTLCFVLQSQVSVGHMDTEHNSMVQNVFPHDFFTTGGVSATTDTVVVNTDIVEKTLELLDKVSIFACLSLSLIFTSCL